MENKQLLCGCGCDILCYALYKGTMSLCVCGVYYFLLYDEKHLFDPNKDLKRTMKLEVK